MATVSSGSRTVKALIILSPLWFTMNVMEPWWFVNPRIVSRTWLELAPWCAKTALLKRAALGAAAYVRIKVR
ncbi:hypothetical protein MPL3356_220282 [Mesorhizobium plurifarium]|uniref:Uncharacterized protein n=1 Tax=Mesorhizobium plurifarium TaxID=69974 RepID=A0A090DS32_MESPL|nr:hypothetical protein MPL3356_220282 [Mesorhizobium plurifarium]CDX36736.1 hypothetical protein MPLDJ20_20673 [Mesorhizobium plurifarium]